MNKYEQLIEYIINEDESKAKALFHNIVVERSREIYESLMDEEDHAMVHDDQVEGLVDEITADHQGMHEDDEEVSDMGDEPMDHGMDMDGADEFGGEHDLEGEHGGEEEIEDRVMDLEDAIDELRAEFHRLMGDEGAGEEGGEEDYSDEGEGEDEVHESMSGMSGKSGKSGKSGSAASGKMEGKNPFAKSGESGKSGASGKSGSSGSGKKPVTEAERLREYVDKVGEVYSQDPTKGEGKTVGTGGDEPTVNKDSIVAGKNDMGGTTANIAKGGAEQAPDGKQYKKPSNEYSKGEGKFSNEQFKNQPGNKKVWDKKETSGHGAEKKSGAEGKTVGTGNSDKPSLNTKSEIGGKVR